MTWFDPVFRAIFSCDKTTTFVAAVFRICIHCLRIRIQAKIWNRIPDPGPEMSLKNLFLTKEIWIFTQRYRFGTGWGTVPYLFIKKQEFVVPKSFLKSTGRYGTGNTVILNFFVNLRWCDVFVTLLPCCNYSWDNKVWRRHSVVDGIIWERS